RRRSHPSASVARRRRGCARSRDAHRPARRTARGRVRRSGSHDQRLRKSRAVLRSALAGQAISRMVGSALGKACKPSLAGLEGASYERRSIGPLSFRRTQMKLRLATLLALTLLSACRKPGDVTTESGGGVYAVRSACPIAGVPAGTGDITLFNPPNSTDSRAAALPPPTPALRAGCQ